MKLKRLPADFRVTEELHPHSSPTPGPFTFYRLTKSSLTTLAALAAIARHWKLPRDAIAFAGLKDKHALTVQHITIHRGPQRGLKQTNLELTPLGTLDRPIHASDIAANRFTVVLRDLTTADHEALSATLSSGPVSFPNYFDSQRFGSLGESNEFIALPWCRGDYERAVWLALTDPNQHDTPAVRSEKRFLRDRWGDWRACRERVRNPDFIPVVNHLAHQPTDFRRAIARTPHELRSLWLAAFQSHLWNQIAASLFRATIPVQELTWQTIGGRTLPFFPPTTKPHWPVPLPLPSARLHLTDPAVTDLYEKTLAAEGLQLRELRVKYPRDSFFSKGERPPALTTHVQYQPADDELHPGRQKATLEFSLPRGAYATMLVKALTGASPEDERDHDTDDSPANE